MESHAQEHRVAVLILLLSASTILGACVRSSKRLGLPPPVPKAAIGRMLIDAVAEDVELRELVDGVWIHTSYFTFPSGTRFGSNGLVVRDGDSLTLVDTAWGEAKTIALLELIDQTIGLPITRAVVTHSHVDRSGGVGMLKALGIEIVAHPETRRLLLADGLPFPEGTEDLDAVGSKLALGALELMYPGPGHAPDNLMVWLPEQQVLFGGCALRTAEASSLGNRADADLESWARAIAWVREQYPDVRFAVPGHGADGGPELLERTATLLAAG